MGNISYNHYTGFLLLLIILYISINSLTNILNIGMIVIVISILMMSMNVSHPHLVTLSPITIYPKALPIPPLPSMMPATVP